MSCGRRCELDLRLTRRQADVVSLGLDQLGVHDRVGVAKQGGRASRPAQATHDVRATLRAIKKSLR